MTPMDPFQSNTPIVSVSGRLTLGSQALGGVPLEVGSPGRRAGVRAWILFLRERRGISNAQWRPVSGPSRLAR